MDAIVAKAFQVWSDAADIEFKKLTNDNDADIQIKFASGEHGDGYENAFDGTYHTEG